MRSRSSKSRAFDSRSRLSYSLATSVSISPETEPKSSFRASSSYARSRFLAVPMKCPARDALSCFGAPGSREMMFVRSEAWSVASYIVKSLFRPQSSLSMSLRRNRAQHPWNVPRLTGASPASAATLSRISLAALFVKVIARIWLGQTPWL